MRKVLLPYLLQPHFNEIYLRHISIPAWTMRRKFRKTNQCPSAFYYLIIEETINRLMKIQIEKVNTQQKKMIFIKYRGKVNEALHTRMPQLQILIPSLKPRVDISLRSRLIIYRVPQ